MQENLIYFSGIYSRQNNNKGSEGISLIVTVCIAVCNPIDIFPALMDGILQRTLITSGI